jgi:hypothetical protein
MPLTVVSVILMELDVTVMNKMNAQHYGMLQPTLLQLYAWKH